MTPETTVGPRPEEVFRDPELVAGLVRAIRRGVERLGRPVILMEVCGTHTVAISRSGIRDLLRGYVELRSGPGCPVCVTAQADIDRMIALSRLPGIVVSSYGDMLRVPGSTGSLEQARAEGADVRIVYSASEAVSAAAADPRNEHVFLGVGFETTAPGAALALRQAMALGLTNFTVYSAHKTLPAALEALLGQAAPRGVAAPHPKPGAARPGCSLGAPDPSAAPDHPGPPAGGTVEGLLLPGHVSAVIGRQAYDFLARDFGLHCAIAGFEPVDILAAVGQIVRALAEDPPAVVNLYSRVVRERGNERARAAIEEVFAPCPADWRGLGLIPGSGLALRGEWRRFDAVSRHGQAASENLARAAAAAARGGKRQSLCACGRILRGELLPPDCPLFGRACSPAEPMGPCMVSSEGSCAAYYRYERQTGVSPS